MRLSYKYKQKIIQLIKNSKKELWRYIDLKKSISTFKFRGISKNYALNRYHHKIYPVLDLSIINETIEALEYFSNKQSKLIDLEEFKSDLCWLKLYYLEKRWSSVIRWLSNIQVTLLDLFYKKR